MCIRDSSYTEHYSLGDIFIYTSADEEKGVLLELKGRGCRQFESYLLAQQRSWYDFLMDALIDGGVMKRIDLAINDHTGCLLYTSKNSEDGVWFGTSEPDDSKGALPYDTYIIEELRLSLIHI